ncbi:MAG: UMP kinase [Bacteroidales bacterium]
MQFKRVLLKLSGEALIGKQNFGIDSESIDLFCQQIKAIVEKNIEVSIVVGGGNIFRGLSGLERGVDRVKGDQMGMLATVINSLAMQSGFENSGIKARVFTAVRMEPFAEYYVKEQAEKSLEEGYVTIIAAGTGNPYFTTDSAAALRALELRADALLKGTRVDGVFSADPEKDETAQKYDRLTYNEAIEKQLGVMDMTAFALCRDNKLPIIVFNIMKEGNLEQLLSGEPVGTLVY